MIDSPAPNFLASILLTHVLCCSNFAAWVYLFDSTTTIIPIIPIIQLWPSWTTILGVFLTFGLCCIKKTLLWPGQVIKLSTSRRLAALLRAACHRGWCVCVCFWVVGTLRETVFCKSVDSEGFEGLKWIYLVFRWSKINVFFDGFQSMLLRELIINIKNPYILILNWNWSYAIAWFFQFSSYFCSRNELNC